MELEGGRDTIPLHVSLGGAGELEGGVHELGIMPSLLIPKLPTVSVHQGAGQVDNAVGPAPGRCSKKVDDVLRTSKIYYENQWLSAKINEFLRKRLLRASLAGLSPLGLTHYFNIICMRNQP